MPRHWAVLAAAVALGAWAGARLAAAYGSAASELDQARADESWIDGDLFPRALGGVR